MRTLIATGVALLLTGVGLPAQGFFRVGAAQRAFVPEKPYNWRGAKTHALVTTVWYPADSASVEKPQWVGPLTAPLFAVGSAAPDPSRAPTREKNLLACKAPVDCCQDD